VEDAVPGSADLMHDPELLLEVIAREELIKARGRGGTGASVYIPLKTVRKLVGVLFVGGQARSDPE